jgi:hypothetical protein
MFRFGLEQMKKRAGTRWPPACWPVSLSFQFGNRFAAGAFF